MHKKSIVFITISIGVFLSWPFVAGIALAVDGVIEINQVRAESGGISPGDSAGFPVTLSQSGSYVLTSNLNVPVDTNGIVITAPDVTINLNGFTVAGNGGDSGHGITSYVSGVGFQDHITVLNGVVKEMGLDGIRIDDQSLVKAIHAHDNANDGIDVGSGSTVSGNTAYANGSYGIAAFSGSSISGNTVNNNGDDGIHADLGCTVNDNSAYYNGDDGIVASSGNTIMGNTVYDNSDDGIFAYAGCTLIGNTARNNDSFGFNLGGNCGYKGNVLTGNNGGNTNKQVSGGTEIGKNVCGTDTTCP